mgnify:CR=1 FL=1
MSPPSPSSDPTSTPPPVSSSTVAPVSPSSSSRASTSPLPLRSRSRSSSAFPSPLENSSRTQRLTTHPPSLSAGVNGLLDRVAVNDVGKWEASFIAHLESSQQALLTEVKKGVMTPAIDASLKKTVVECVSSPSLVSGRVADLAFASSQPRHLVRFGLKDVPKSNHLCAVQSRDSYIASSALWHMQTV